MVLTTEYKSIILHSDTEYNTDSFEIILPKNGWVTGNNHVNLSNAGDNIIRYDNKVDIFSEYTNSSQNIIRRREISPILCKKGNIIKFVGTMPQYCYLVLYPIEE